VRYRAAPIFNKSAIANMAWSLGESLFAMRVKDLLRAVEFGSQFGNVHLVGLDMGALWAIVAAALDPGIASVSTQGGGLDVNYFIPVRVNSYKVTWDKLEFLSLHLLRDLLAISALQRLTQ
jgi:pimeloyl-ACP methyl ester carboxylesterase